MYFIFEIQQMTDGTYAHLVHVADTRRQAESVYHQTLAYAAMSNLPRHSVSIILPNGSCLVHTSYVSATPEEPNDEE